MRQFIRDSETKKEEKRRDLCLNRVTQFHCGKGTAINRDPIKSMITELKGRNRTLASTVGHLDLTFTQSRYHVPAPIYTDNIR